MLNLLIIAQFAIAQCAAIVPLNIGTGPLAKVESALQWVDINKHLEGAVSVSQVGTPLYDVRGVINGEASTILIAGKPI